MNDRMIEVGRDCFASVVRDQSLGLHGVPTSTESMSVMQFVRDGIVLAQAIYEPSRFVGGGVVVRYEVDRSTLNTPSKP